MARKKGKKIDYRRKKNLVYVKFAIVTFLIVMVSLIAFLIYHYTKSTPEGETIHTTPNNGTTQPWWKSYTPVHRVGNGANDFLIEYGSEYPNSGASVNHPSWVQMRLSSKPVLILAHSTTCVPCVKQSEDANKVITKYGSEFDFVDILTDSNDPTVQQMVQDVYNVYPDPQYPSSIPLTIIVTKVNRNGVEIAWQSYVGATGYEILEAWVKDAIYYYKSVTLGREIETQEVIFCELFDSGDKEICDCSDNATDALYMLKSEYPSIVMLDCPSFGELSNEYCENRASYYGIVRFPMLVIDGTNQVEGGDNTEEYYQKYKEAIDARLRVKKANMSIMSSAIRNENNTYAQVTVDLGENAGRQGLYLHSVLYVKELEFGKLRKYVAKKEVGNFVLNSSRIQVFNLAFSHAYTDSNTILGLCNFVQDVTNKEILCAKDTEINYSENMIISNRSSKLSCISDFRYVVENQNVTYVLLVTNIGNKSDVFVFSAEGLPDKWNVEFENSEIELDSKESKNITVILSPPPLFDEYDKNGRLVNISIISKPKGSEFGISQILLKAKTEEVMMPDLALTAQSVDIIDKKLVVYVHNYGTKDANANVTVYVNGTFVAKKECKFLRSSVSKVEFEENEILVDICKVCIVIDEDAKVAEYDEKNNIFGTRTPENTTENAPLITDLSYNPKEPKKGDNVTFSVKVIDDDLVSVKIRYCGSFCTIPIVMNYEDGRYTHTVSTGLFSPGLVEYHIEGKDAKGHISYLNGSFTLGIEEIKNKEDNKNEQTPILILISVIVLSALICIFVLYYVFVSKKKRKKEQRKKRVKEGKR